MPTFNELTSFDLAVACIFALFLARGAWIGLVRQLAAFLALVDAVGAPITEVALPQPFATAHETLKTIMEAEQAVNYGPLWERDAERISPPLRAMIERGRMVSAVEWHRAVAMAAALRRSLADLFDRFDAIVTPAAPGEAPIGLESTGSPVFCTIWSLLGLPAVTLPLLRSPDGLPLGIQVVGAFGEDARLLATAAWLEQEVGPRSAGGAELPRPRARS